MKAAIFHEHGGPDVVRVEEVERPTPGAGEVLVRVRAAAMNHLDLWVRRGMPIETTMPHIGGSDVAGVVEELGPGVEPRRSGGASADDAGSGAAPPGASGLDAAVPGTPVVVNPSLYCGDCEWCRQGREPLCRAYRILGEHTQGGFAEYVVVPARNLYAIPRDYPAEEAAAAPLAFLTAWRGLMTRGRLEAGQTVLVTGASGGVSTAAIQIAKLAGAQVFAVTSTPHVERVQALGADGVFDRLEQDYGREVWTRTGRRGVDVVLDSVGSATWDTNVRCLARAGRLVVYGGTTGPKVELDLRQVFWKQLEVVGTTMSTSGEFDRVMGLVFGGRLTPAVDLTLPLDSAREAHERLERGDAFGKIVLMP